MPNPTFDSTALTTDAAAERIGPPRPRAYRESLPGVRGEFVQLNGTAGRDIAVTGIYKGPPCALAADAHAALKAAILAVQAKVGAAVGTYVGTDGRSYGNCVLLSFESAGAVRLIRVAGNWQGVAPVRGAVRHLAP